MSKKGKKSKGKTLNLQDFLSENGAPPTGSVVTKSLSWANECEEDEYSSTKILTFAIPTAPRSQRVLDDSTIPTSPPFSAHISNLPYDLNETDIQEFFENVTNSVVLSVRLPREDGDTGRMRGFGYIEFSDRDGLIAAVSQPELTLRNRKIRIDVSTENDSKRGGGNRRYDNFGASENRDSNWRRGQDSNDSSSRRSAVENGGNWRSGDRPKMESPPPARRGYGRRNNDFDDRNRRDDDRPLAEERPRIKLNPRTLPLPELQIDERERERETPKTEVIKPRPKPVPSAAIFGAAKPVDTATKDREIEARLEKERERIQKEAELAEKEKAEKAEMDENAEKENATTPDDSEEIAHENGDDEHHDNDDESGASADKTIADKPPAEVISWRRKPEDDAQGEEHDQERRSHSPTRKRYSPDRRRRQHPDERRGPRDNNRRDNYNNRDKRDFNRDYQRNDRDRDRNYNREKTDRPQNRNYNNRGGPPQQHRDERDNKPRRAPQNPDEIENRMPKFKADVKPKIQMSNAYEIFNDEASD